MPRKIDLLILHGIMAIVCLFGCAGTSGARNERADEANSLGVITEIENTKEEEVEVFPQLGHSDTINSVVFSPDGKLILSGSRDTLKLWDVATGREIKTFFGHTGWVHSLIFNSDGKQALSCSSDGTIKIWDIVTGREIKTFSARGNVYNITLSPDGKKLLSSGHSTILWDVSSGQEIMTFAEYRYYARFDPSGKKIISSSFNRIFKLWDIATGQEIMTFPGDTSGVWTLSFNPDGNQVLFGFKDGTIKLWDTTSRQEIATFYGHTGYINSLVFSPDGKHIISGSSDNTIKLWNVESGQEIRTFTGHTNQVLSVSLSLDSKQILSYSLDNTIRLWDIENGHEIRTFSGHTEEVKSATFSPTGKQILSHSDDGTIKLWDVESGHEIRTFSGHTSWVSSMAFSPDGRQVLFCSADSTIRQWDTSTGSRIKTFSGHRGWVQKVSYSLDGKQILSSSRDRTIKLWDAASGEEIRTFSGHTLGVNDVSFSPDDKLIISGCANGTIKLWETDTGREIKTFSGHINSIYSVCFSPDGKQVLSGSQDRTIKLWDVTSGEEIRTFSGHTFYVSSVSFSSDGKQFLSSSGDRTIKLWDVESGREIKTFLGHSAGVSKAHFSPDGRQVLSCSRDNTIKLWEIATGKEIKTYSGHLNDVSSVSFSPDGKSIYSSSADGTVRLWDLETDKEIVQFISFFGNDSQLISNARDISFVVEESIADISGEWVCITPDGYYTASPMGDRYLNVRVGNRVTGIDSFRDIFYNPDVVRARLAGEPDPTTKKTVTIQDVLSFFPSTIALETPSFTTTTGTTNLTINISDDNQPIETVKIFINGNLVGRDELMTASGAHGLQAERASLTVTGNQKNLSFNIPLVLDPGNNLIEVVSFNGYAESRRSTNVTWRTDTDHVPELPNLWILAVGVNRYNDTGINNLNYCANDAREIINSFKAQEGRCYTYVNTLLVADDEGLEPTMRNIQESLTFLDRAGPRDIILLFLAGHGMNGKDGMFQFLPRDAVRNPDGSFSNVITVGEISQVLETPGKRLILIDACHSGGIDNDRMIRQMMDTNAYVFASSKGNEFSLELAELRHGVFTYSIIDTMRNSALRTVGNLSVIGLSGNVSIDVPKRTNNRQNPVGYSLGFYDFIIGE